MSDWLINALLRIPFYVAGIAIMASVTGLGWGLVIVAAGAYVTQIKFEIHRS